MRGWLLLLLFAGCDDGTASPDVSIDLSIDVSAAAAVDGGIGCGNTSCSLAGATVVCCIEAVSQYCAPPSACSAGTPAYCDGPEDCAGSCCRFDSSLISCAAQCPGEIVCHGDRDCPASSPRCCDQAGYRACATSCS